MPPAPVWTITFTTTTLRSGPSDDSDSLGDLHQLTYLQVLGYTNEWAQVLNPRTKATGYVHSDALGPTDPPPAYLTAAPPPTVDQVNLPGRVVGTEPLAFYPTADAAAQTGTAYHNDSIFIVDTVHGDDGSTWYRDADGDFLPEDGVRLPSPPPRTYSGRWVDADLNEPAMLTAYEGDKIVLATLTIKGSGANVTPTGVFSIQRRVADETMNSETLGVPRNAPGGYYLEHVLWTQYFTSDGASIHYNYWSSNFGYAASHGCLGLSYEDSHFMWDWATVGTTVSIHY